MRADNVVGVVHGKLNFSHKLFEGKYAVDTVMPSYGPSIGVELGTSYEILDVTLLSGPMLSLVLKSLIHEARALQEIIDTSSRRKATCEELMAPTARNTGASSSLHAPHIEDTNAALKKKP